MFAFLKSLLARKTIAQLRSADPHGWCYKYFPEYAELFGGYPASLPVFYRNENEKVHGTTVYGRTRPVELAPWEYFDGKNGSIDQYGYRWKVEEFPGGGKRMSKSPVSEEEYVKWCDSVNYFRNGNVGLDPSVFVGAAAYRGSEYMARWEQYLADEAKPKDNRRIRVKPDIITCASGRYFPQHGPTPSNPWGVNSVFIPNGENKPSYISKIWGPDYASDTAQQAGGPLIKYYDPERDGPRPSQEDYDQDRWSVWL